MKIYYRENERKNKWEKGVFYILPSSETSKKLPNVYKSCLKMISLEKW